jgi:hypothetical protein
MTKVDQNEAEVQAIEAELEVMRTVMLTLVPLNEEGRERVMRTVSTFYDQHVQPSDERR